jgi:choline dehydrogenase-like flavoprotein
LLSGETLPGSAIDCPQVRVDVCIIGAGPAGLTLAEQLIGSGLRTLVLERGTAVAPKPDERTGLHTGHPYSVDDSRSFGVGGTARQWSVETPDGPGRVRLRELDRGDVDGRSWPAQTRWPITYAELARWYPTARRICGLGPVQPSDANDRFVAVSGGQIGLSFFEFGSSEAFTRTIPRRLDDHPEVEVMYETRALAIEGLTAWPFRADGVLARHETTGQMLRVSSSFVAVCAGAVETVRLLAETSTSSATELGNIGGQLGVGFMEHPNYRGGALILSHKWSRSLRGLKQFESLDGRVVERRYVLSEACRERHRLLGNHARFRRARWSSFEVSRALLDAQGRPDAPPEPTAERSSHPTLGGSRGRSTQATVLARLLAPRRGRRTAYGSSPARGLSRDVLVLICSAEQLRRASSRVHLGPRGPDGTREANVDIQLTTDDYDSMEHWPQLLGGILEDAGVGRFVAPFERSSAPDSLAWGHHHLGTTVMSYRPEDGVVDPDCLVHGTSNVYVGSSSVFPTGGYANPTLTIVALACRLAATLRARASK